MAAAITRIEFELPLRWPSLISRLARLQTLHLCNLYCSEPSSTYYLPGTNWSAVASSLTELSVNFSTAFASLVSVNETTPLSSLWPHLTSLKIAGLQWLPRRDPQQFLRGLPRSLLELNLAFPDAPFSIFDLPLLPKSLTNLTLCMIVPNDPDTQPSAEMHACLDQLPPQLTQLGLLCPFFPSFIEHLPTADRVTIYRDLSSLAR